LAFTLILPLVRNRVVPRHRLQFSRSSGALPGIIVH
jgi:hypothetical protein